MPPNAPAPSQEAGLFQALAETEELSLEPFPRDSQLVKVTVIRKRSVIDNCQRTVSSVEGLKG
jgi:hypothetical protein